MLQPRAITKHKFAREPGRRRDSTIAHRHDQLRAQQVDDPFDSFLRSEEHTSELQSQSNLVCRLLLEKKNRSTISFSSCMHSKYAISGWYPASTSVSNPLLWTDEMPPHSTTCSPKRSVSVSSA